MLNGFFGVRMGRGGRQGPGSALSIGWLQAYHGVFPGKQGGEGNQLCLQAPGCPYPAGVRIGVTYPRTAPGDRAWALQRRETQSAVLEANTDLVGSSKRPERGVLAPQSDAHSNWCVPQQRGGKRGQPSKQENRLWATKAKKSRRSGRRPRRL